jgi:sugar O-acyltransferase (sialic acid O-acetyltransferase NeuD family)
MPRLLSSPILVLGGGGHAKVLLDLLKQLDARVSGVIDPAFPTGFSGVLGQKVLGNDDAVLQFKPTDVLLVNAIGSTRPAGARSRIFDYFAGKGYTFATLVHPSAIVCDDTRLGEGAQVMAGAIVQAGARLSANVLVNTGASIDHDCEIGAHVHIAPGAVLSGGVHVGADAHIGTGAVVIQSVRIGERAMIGAGVTVLADVPTEVSVRASDQVVWTKRA